MASISGKKIIVPVQNSGNDQKKYTLHTAIDCVEGEDNFSIPDGIDIEVDVQKVDHDFLLSIHVQGWGFFLCDRCGESSKKAIDGHINTVFTLDTDKIEEDNDDYKLWDGSEKGIDITQDVLDTLLLSLPAKMLCKKDCLGLCPVCGQNLNEKSCHCTRDITDSRWDALKNIEFD